MWGEIPSSERKPSNGWPHADKLTHSSNAKGRGGSFQMMMDKEGLKNKTKKKENKKNDQSN